jgi:hypothetical protein
VDPAPGYLAPSHKRLLLYNNIIKGKKNWQLPFRENIWKKDIFELAAVTVAASVVRKKSKKKKQLISIHVE